MGGWMVVRARPLGLTGRRAADSLVWQAVLPALPGVTTGAVLSLGPRMRAARLPLAVALRSE